MSDKTKPNQIQNRWLDMELCALFLVANGFLAMLCGRIISNGAPHI